MPVLARNLHQACSRKLQLHRHVVDVGLGGHQELPVAQELVALVALRDVPVRVDLVVEERRETGARVYGEVAADLIAAVADPLPQKKLRGRDGASRKDHAFGAHAKRTPRPRDSLDPHSATTLDENGVRAQARQNHAATLQRRRQVGDLGAAARAGAAAEVTKTVPRALRGIALHRPVTPAEVVAASRHDRGDGADPVERRRRHQPRRGPRPGRSDARERLGRKLLGPCRSSHQLFGAPAGRRRTKAGAGAYCRGATDKASREDGHGHVAHREPAAIEAGVCAHRASVEGGARHVVSLPSTKTTACPRSASSRPTTGASGTRPDDHHVAFERLAALPRLGRVNPA